MKRTSIVYLHALVSMDVRMYVCTEVLIIHPVHVGTSRGPSRVCAQQPGLVRGRVFSYETDPGVLHIVYQSVCTCRVLRVQVFGTLPFPTRQRTHQSSKKRSCGHRAAERPFIKGPGHRTRHLQTHWPHSTVRSQGTHSQHLSTCIVVDVLPSYPEQHCTGEG